MLSREHVLEVADKPARIKYCYTLGYDDDADCVADNAMHLNARVYAAAEKYKVPKLKKLALTKFKKAVAASMTDNTMMLSIAETVYNEVELPADDQTLRQIIVRAWIQFYSVRTNALEPRDDSTREQLTPFIRSLGEFFFDVQLALVEAMNGVDTGELYADCMHCQTRARLVIGDHSVCENCNTPHEDGREVFLVGCILKLEGFLGGS